MSDLTKSNQKGNDQKDRFEVILPTNSIIANKKDSTGNELLKYKLKKIAPTTIKKDAKDKEVLKGREAENRKLKKDENAVKIVDKDASEINKSNMSTRQVKRGKSKSNDDSKDDNFRKAELGRVKNLIIDDSLKRQRLQKAKIKSTKRSKVRQIGKGNVPKEDSYEEVKLCGLFPLKYSTTKDAQHKNATRLTNVEKKFLEARNKRKQRLKTAAAKNRKLIDNDPEFARSPPVESKSGEDYKALRLLKYSN